MNTLPFTRETYYRLAKQRGLTEDAILAMIPKNAQFKDEVHSDEPHGKNIIDSDTVAAATQEQRGDSEQQQREHQLAKPRNDNAQQRRRRLVPQLPIHSCTNDIPIEARDALLLALAHYVDALGEVDESDALTLACLRMTAVFLVPQPKPQATLFHNLFSRTNVPGIGCSALSAPAAAALHKITHPSLLAYYAAKSVALAIQRCIVDWSRLDLKRSDAPQRATSIAARALRVAVSKCCPSLAQARVRRIVSDCLDTIDAALRPDNAVGPRGKAASMALQLNASRLAYVSFAYEPARGVFAVLGDEDEYVIRVQANAALFHALCGVLADASSVRGNASSVFALCVRNGIQTLAEAGRVGGMMTIGEADAALAEQDEAIDDTSDESTDDEETDEETGADADADVST